MLAWATSVAADAPVTFNFQTGVGFVDRSEAQAAFGLNYGQLQKRAEQAVFSMVQTTTVAVICAIGPPKQAESEISATVDFTIVPAKGSIDGFALTGLRDILIADPPPATQICGGAGTFGAQISVVRRLSGNLGGQTAVLLEEH